MTKPLAAQQDKDGERFYPIPDPATGEIHKLPSITRVMKVLNKPGLHVYDLKRIAYAVATQQDLQALAASAEDERDRVLFDVVNKAKGRTVSAADVGTALHTFTEQADAGKLNIARLPKFIGSVLERYEDLKAVYQWKVVESEVTVYHFGAGYAGTTDRIIDVPGLGVVIADIKTGKVHDDVALQLAAAANAEGIWDAGSNQYLPMPEVRKDIACVIHLPANGSGARLVRIELDEVDAWEGFLSCVEAFDWERNRAKLAVKGEVERPRPAPSSGGSEVSPRPSAPYGVDLPVESGDSTNVGRPPQGSTSSTGNPVPSDAISIGGQVPTSDGTLAALRRERRDWLTGRIERLKADYPDALRALTFVWPEGVPTLKKADDHTDEQLDLINAALWQVEKDHGVPFPDDDQVVAQLREQFDVEEHERRLTFAPEWQELVEVAGGWLADVVPEHLRWTDLVRLAVGTAFEAGDLFAARAGDSYLLDRLVERYGSKGNVLKAARGLSKFGFKFPVPRSAAAVAEDPLCVALLLHYKHPKKGK